MTSVTGFSHRFQNSCSKLELPTDVLVSAFRQHQIETPPDSLTTEKNKNCIVPSPEVNKSDFTVGFSVVDLVETRFGWWISGDGTIRFLFFSVAITLVTLVVTYEHYSIILTL